MLHRKTIKGSVISRVTSEVKPFAINRLVGIQGGLTTQRSEVQIPPPPLKGCFTAAFLVSAIFSAIIKI